MSVTNNPTSDDPESLCASRRALRRCPETHAPLSPRYERKAPSSGPFRSGPYAAGRHARGTPGPCSRGSPSFPSSSFAPFHTPPRTAGAFPFFPPRLINNPSFPSAFLAGGFLCEGPRGCAYGRSLPKGPRLRKSPLVSEKAESIACSAFRAGSLQ